MEDKELKRGADRHAIWIPMTVEQDGGFVLAISRDISEIGIKLVTAVDPKVGSRVTVMLALDDEGGEREVKGTIVRVEKNTDDPRGAYPHRVAVAFDEPLEQLDSALVRLSERAGPI